MGAGRRWALIEGGLRLPLTPLAAQFHETVREALREAGIVMPGLRMVEERA